MSTINEQPLERLQDALSSRAQHKPALKVAYVLLYFPRMTETFIADEIQAIISRNIDVKIISLLPASSSELTQPVSQKLLKYTSYAPGLTSIAIWKAQLHFLYKASHLYIGLLARFLGQPYPNQPAALFLKRLAIFLKAVAVANYLEISGVDLLHTHFAWLSGGAAWICARLLDKPFTVTVHAFDIYSSKRELLGLVSREAAHVVAVSEFNRQQVSTLGICPAEAVSVIHCGIDLAGLDVKIKTPSSDRLPDTTLKILSVGSLVPKKGHDILIDACRLLKEKGLRFVCTIVGNGPELNKLNKMIYEKSLQSQVVLAGARLHPAIIEAYRQNDIFVLASRIASDGDRDGIPVVLMEAGWEGLPIVSTTVSGIPELVQHMQTGLLIPPDEPIALADAILTLAADSKLRRQLGQNAKTFVKSRFGIENTSMQLSNLFSNIVLQWGNR